MRKGLTAFNITSVTLGLAFLYLPVVILVIYSVLLVRVQRLARYPRPSRFLTGAVEADGARSVAAR